MDPRAWRGELVGRIRRLAGGPLRRTALGVVVVPLALAVGLTAFASNPGDPGTSRVLTAADLERDYGIRVERVAVTAAGGLVDLRFTVLDQTKAVALFHDAATVPAIYVEQRGVVLRTKKGMAHHLSLVTGGRYFILFSNAGGVVQAGTPVSVLIDDVRLTAIAAQS